MFTNLKRRLTVEGLESRAMLAGNVSASVSGGSLIITGDDAANGVAIQQIDIGRYAVIGFSHGAGTTNINGTAGAKVFSGITNDFNIDLGGGDDALFITQSTALQAGYLAEFSPTSGPIGANPETPNGRTTDPIRTTVPRNLFVDASVGNDVVATNVRVGRDGFGGVATYTGGEGNDQFALERSIYKSTLVANSGADADFLRLSNVGVAGTTDVHMGSGDDLVRVNKLVATTAIINTGASSDRGIFIANSHTDGDMILLSENGEDTISVRDSSVDGDLVVNSGIASDTITATNVQVGGDVTVNAGDGNDIVRVDNVDVADDVFFYLGAGNDTLRIKNSSVDLFFARGGGGLDQLINEGGNTFGSTDIAEFE